MSYERDTGEQCFAILHEYIVKLITSSAILSSYFGKNV